MQWKPWWPVIWIGTFRRECIFISAVHTVLLIIYMQRFFWTFMKIMKWNLCKLSGIIRIYVLLDLHSFPSIFILNFNLDLVFNLDLIQANSLQIIQYSCRLSRSKDFQDRSDKLLFSCLSHYFIIAFKTFK